MDSARIIHTSTEDPWWNLAVEEFLLERVEQGQCILYLWQNRNTVVIGRNQNPWRECRPELLESEGGKLARRLSGGGAVFHDLGNLNFTFIAGRGVYDLDRQMDTILNAVGEFGIKAEKSGRNDLTADGRKFSGNAFYIRGNKALHHGTILISADFNKLARYLRVPEDKMRSKGIKSVQSRVVNLTELIPRLTVVEMAQALTASFRSAYGSTAPVEYRINDGKADRDEVNKLYAKYSSWDWRYGETADFDVQLENRFGWGGIEIGLNIENGMIRKAKTFSDAMEEAFIAVLPKFLLNCPYDSKQLANRLKDAAAAFRGADTYSFKSAGGDALTGTGMAEFRGADAGAFKDTGEDEPRDTIILNAVNNCISRDRCAELALDMAEWLECKSF